MAEPISLGGLIGLSAASAAFSGGASLGVSAVKNRKSYKYTKKLLAEQEKYRKLAFQDSVDFWKQQNAYDNPLNQTSRLRSAGLSPLSQYGVQGSQGLSSVQGVDASQFQADGAHLPSVDLAQLVMQKQSVEADVVLKNADAKAREADARLKNSQAVDQEWKNTLQPQYEQQLDSLISITDSQAAQEAIKTVWLPFEKSMQVALGSADLKLKDKALQKFDAEIDELKSKKVLNDELANEAKESARNLAARTITEGTKRENIKADTDYKKSLKQTEDDLRDVRKDLTASQRNKIVQDIRNSKALTAKEIEQFAQWLNGNYPTSSIGGIADKLARKFQIHGSSIDEAETIRQGLLDYLRGFKD